MISRMILFALCCLCFGWDSCLQGSNNPPSAADEKTGCTNVIRTPCISPDQLVTHRLDSFEVQRMSGDTIRITHYRLSLNCCLDSVSVDAKRSNDTLRLLEREVAANPCECLCDYRLACSLYPVAPGRYYILIDQARWGNRIAGRPVTIR